MSTDKNTSSKPTPNKSKKSLKISKKETQGNILLFYALQHAASIVLDSKINPFKIEFKTPIKAKVQYLYEADKGLSDQQKDKIMTSVNDMLKSNTKVSCSKIDTNNDYKIPKGINIKQQLYQLQINDILGISHIPISVSNLGSFTDFKIISCDYDTSKKSLRFFYSFQTTKQSQNNNNNNNASNTRVTQQNDMKVSIESAEVEQKYEKYEKIEKDDRTVFAKEIIALVINDLNVKNVDKENSDKLFRKVHDILNQFQSIAYTKGYKAASYNK